MSVTEFFKIVQLLLIKGILGLLCHTSIVHGNVAVIKCEVRYIKTPRKRHVATTLVDRSYRSLWMIGNTRKSSHTSGWSWFSFGTGKCPACFSLLLLTRSRKKVWKNIQGPQCLRIYQHVACRFNHSTSQLYCGFLKCMGCYINMWLVDFHHSTSQLYYGFLGSMGCTLRVV